MPERDVLRNSWLCEYAICQIGKPYWFATSGQISTPELFRNVVSPAIQAQLGEYSLAMYSNYMDQLNVKVHDCAGLIAGALTCESVGAEPTLPNPLNNQQSIFYADCTTRSDTMSDFPYIPGTIVFYSNYSGVKVHVGIYVGTFTDINGQVHTDEVVEARGHDFGVVTSSIDNAKWDSWGQLDCCVIDTTTTTTFDARTSSVAGAGTVNINAEAMTPFVATIAPQTNPTLDYDKIKEARISAMAFFGGELYDGAHNKRTYINPYLDNQVQQCNSAGMSYMLYVNIRARNEIEADAECKALYYIVSHYPPRLGLWLCLKTNNSVALNDSIIEIYYKYILKWGLKEKCGLYLDKSQLSNISWTSFQDRFYLWLIEPKDVNTVDNELLQPEMFEVPD